MSEAMDNVVHQVHSVIMQDHDLQDYDVEVLDNNGIITLRGTVPTRSARDRAEALARRVEGVKNVINEIDVI